MPVVNVDFLDLLNFLSDNTHSDLHVSSGHRPYIRNRGGSIEELKDFPTMTEKEIGDAVAAMAGNDLWQLFQQNKELDFAYDFRKQKLRVNVYRDMNGISMAMRMIPNKIPTLDDIFISDEVAALLNRKKGLILVTGPTGAGKSTTLAAMIEHVNKTLSRHIITIEDPVEFVFENKKSLINQREIGRHTHDFTGAIRSALREDPDIIMIGEMRDLETIQAAMTIAETGHLVLSTLHTNDTVQSINRIVNVFPSEQQNQIRLQLSMCLTAVISQTLVPRKGKQEKIVAREVLINNDAVRTLILENAPHRLYSVVETSRKEGMILMDQYLEWLLKKGYIDEETFQGHVRDRDLAAER